MKLWSLICGLYEPKYSVKRRGSKKLDDISSQHDQNVDYDSYGKLPNYTCRRASHSIVERDSNESSWKGVIFGPKCSSRIGRFPASTVQLVDRKVGMQRSASQRRAKKVCMPVVPDVSRLTNYSGMMNPDSQKTPATPPFAQSSPYNSWVSSCGSEISDRSAVCNSLAQTSQLNDNLALAGCKAQSVIFTGATTMDGGCGGGYSSQPLSSHQQLQHQNVSGLAGNGPCSSSLLLSSPLRHRNSTGSTSSRSSSGFESMKSGSQQYSHTIINALRGDSPPSRNSVHSSGSSSLGSLERLDESTCSTSQANIAEMILNGIPDHEIISAWLHDLHYEEYLQLFLNAGYDLATVARMTPEDLTAIGITKPGHRKRLTTEIHKMNVIDNWPDKKPDAVDEWLSALRLNEYTQLFVTQGYNLMDKVLQLTWEDFEDIGVKKLGHLKKLVCALKKMTASTDSRSQPQQQHKKSSGFGGYGEVLVINVPPAQRSLSDISRPFLTQNERQNSHSPQTMSTFQQSSKLTSSQEFLANSSRSPTPCRSPYIAPYIAVQSNGNYSYVTVPECSTTNYDIFPPWRERTVNVAQGALQRLHSVGNDCEPSCSSAGQGDFGVGVQARSLIKIVAKTRRNNRDYGSTATDKPAIDNNCGEQFASASCESLLRKSFHQATDSPTRHPFLQHQHNSTESRYPYVDLCTRSVMAYDERQSSPQLCSPRSYSNGSLPICGSSSLVLSNLNSPKNGPSNGTVRNICCPETAAPPKKPPPPRSNIFQLSSAEPAQFDDSCSSSELSPAQSVDEFPPPPFPITCEEQIKNLRSIRGNTQMRQPLSVTGIDMNDALMKLSTSSEVALQKQDKMMAKQNRNDSTASVDSNSSTETLPFAQENVGTIKQKTTPIGNGAGHGTGPIRPHVGDVFGRPESERPEFQAPKSATGTNSDGLNTKPGNVLNDIGHMLQDLTDQLDALLCEPASNAPATKVN